MKILIIPSVRMKSGTGIRLYGIANALKKDGYEVEIAETRRQKFFSDADVVFASKTLLGSCAPSMFRKMFKSSLMVLDIDDLEWGYWKKNRFLKRYLVFSDKNLPRYFDLITTHTKALKEYIIKDLKVPEDKIVLLPQGVDFSMFKNITWKPSGTKKIVYTAHLGVAAMDVDIILKVFKNIHRKEDAVLQIIGSGPYLQHFKDMAKRMGISDSVEFLGYVDHEKIPKIISKASVAVNYLRDSLANRYRSSIKVREYLAIGIPTVCNIIGDTSLFSDYVYGFKTGNVKAFENRIALALKKPDKGMGIRGRKFIRDYWDWSRVIKDFEKELESLCGKNI